MNNRVFPKMSHRTGFTLLVCQSGSHNQVLVSVGRFSFNRMANGLSFSLLEISDGTYDQAVTATSEIKTLRSIHRYEINKSRSLSTV